MPGNKNRVIERLIYNVGYRPAPFAKCLFRKRRRQNKTKQIQDEILIIPTSVCPSGRPMHPTRDLLADVGAKTIGKLAILSPRYDDTQTNTNETEKYR